MSGGFWNENANQWIQVSDSVAIESRKITNPAIVKVIKDLQLESLLDAGCGEGWLARALPSSIDYMGVDGSAGLIEKAIERSQQKFEVASYQDLVSGQWKPKRLFQGIVFNFALLDKEISPLLKQMGSFLTPQGRLIIQTLHPCFKMPKYEDAWFTEDFKSISVAFKGTMPWYGRTLSSWVQLFSQSGFHLEQMVEPKMNEIPISIIFILKK